MRLRPIEKPKGLMMKIAYFMTRRQFGKVMMPMKVVLARMPGSEKFSWEITKFELNKILWVIKMLLRIKIKRLYPSGEYRSCLADISWGILLMSGPRDSGWRAPFFLLLAGRPSTKIGQWLPLPVR